MEPTTLNNLLCRRFSENATRPALGWKVKGKYEYNTYGDLEKMVRQAAAALVSLGVEPGDRVALLSENRHEWAVSDLAIQWAGAITAPMFSTLPAKQVEYIVNDAGARLLIVSDREQFQKAIEVRQTLSGLERVVVFDDAVDLGGQAWALHWNALCAGGSDGEADEVERRRAAVGPDDLASLIYTSGTTGEPKGAMLTHNNFASNAIGAAKAFELTPDDRFLSFLPLAHVFERLAGHYLPLSVGASIAYTESIRTIANNMQEVQPTIFLGVPRLWEMLMERVLDRRKQLKGFQRFVYDWSLRVADRVGKARLRGEKSGAWDSVVYGLADKLVYQKIRHNLGGKLRLGGAGGAPLPPSVCEFFFGIGVLLLEGYGLTETSPVISVNTPPMPRVGTVGPLIEGVEVKIAEDGEILSRGPHIMRGYWNKPEATREAIDRDGWFHTGDIGTMVDGCLKITDRKKNILVLANGKNVAPSLVENTVLRSPYIGQVVVLGDRQKTITALVVPNFSTLKEWGEANGVKTDREEDLIKEASVTKLFRQELDRLSQDLAEFERIRRFSLLPRELTIADGELTPTMKVKRKVVEEKYRDLIASMAD